MSCFLFHTRTSLTKAESFCLGVNASHQEWITGLQAPSSWKACLRQAETSSDRTTDTFIHYCWVPMRKIQNKVMIHVQDLDFNKKIHSQDVC